MASHGHRAFQDISRERRVMLNDCRAYVTTEISRLQRRLQRLPAEINEGIRALRQILEVLEEELANEAPTPRFRNQQMMLFDNRRESFAQPRERISRNPIRQPGFRYTTTWRN